MAAVWGCQRVVGSAGASAWQVVAEASLGDCEQFFDDGRREQIESAKHSTHTSLPSFPAGRGRLGPVEEREGKGRAAKMVVWVAKKVGETFPTQEFLA